MAPPKKPKPKRPNQPKAPRNLKELHEAMDREDEQEGYRKVPPPKAVERENPPPPPEPDSSDSELDDDDIVGAQVFDEDWAKHVESVARAIRTPEVRKRYQNSLSRFTLFLYNITRWGRKTAAKRKELPKYQLLHPELLLDLDSIPVPPLPKNRKKPTRKEKAALSKRNKVLREIAIKHIDRASPNYHPIDLNKLEAKVFLEHLLNLTATKDDKYLKTYGTHRSALTMLFCECEVPKSKQFEEQLKGMMKGIKNKSAAARQKTGERLTEGKDPLPFKVYVALCRLFLQRGDKMGIFAHCFLTLTWNLMCRSRNTVLLRKEHMSWENDYLAVQFAHSKTDQGGEDAPHKRAVFANPHLPEICPILSLARYMLIYPTDETGDLFEGASQYERFRKILSEVVRDNADEIRRLGIDPKNVGVHSIRKGAATYCSNGTPTEVAFTAVCARAGWSLGNVKDRYIHLAEAGDQVCGRALAGLDVNSHKFSVSPPFFAVEVEEEIYVDNAITTLFGTPTYEWGLMIRHFLASLLYHRAWMETHVGPDFLKHSRLYRPNTDFDFLVTKIRVCYPWTNEEGKRWQVSFTGLPQAVIDFNYHQQQLAELKKLPQILVEAIGKELDRRQIGGGELTMEMLRKQLIEPMESSINKRIEDLVRGLAPGRHESKNDSSAAGLGDRDEADSKVQSDLFARMRRHLPDDYEIDHSGSCQTAWVYWHCGECRTVKQTVKPSDGKDETAASEIVTKKYLTPPWKSLKLRNLKSTAGQKGYFYNLKFLCQYLDDKAGFLPHFNPTEQQVVEAYKRDKIQAILNGVAAKTGRGSRGAAGNNWDTVARNLKKSLKDESNPFKPVPKKRKAPVSKSGSGAQRKKVKVKMEVPSTPPPTKTGDGDAEDLCKIVELTRREIALWKSPKKKERTIEGGPKVVFEIAGPLPDDPDTCSLKLYEEDVSPIGRSGMMLHGSTTTGYLNALSRREGVTRTTDSFCSLLDDAHLRGGMDHLFKEFVENAVAMGRGNHLINWESDPLILCQVFRGPTEYGHWASLVIDRTFSPGLVVFFDSMPGCFPNSMQQLQEKLAAFPLDGLKWIRAEMPHQAPGTLDCGVLMSTGMAAYVRGRHHLLNQIEPPEASHNIKQVRFIAKDDMLEIGWDGRSHILETLCNDSVDLNDGIFSKFYVEWLNK
jgi:hypothetical protein